MGDPVDYLHTGRVGIAVTKTRRVLILAVAARDGRLRVVETDLELGDGRTLHAYDAGGKELGIRWVSYDRPGYGGSTPSPDRAVLPRRSYPEKELRRQFVFPTETARPQTPWRAREASSPVRATIRT